MEETSKTEAETVAALAAMGLEVRAAETDAKPFVIVPEGYEVRDIESHLQAPIRKRGTVSVRDAESFIAVVKAQASEATVLYRTVEPPRFVAVFNDHAGGPGWGDHTAIYDCPLSPEWRAWHDANKRVMKQEDFAQFIEDNLPDVVKPAAASMLEVSRSLQAKKKVSFASGIRLDNGETQFTYEEKVDGTAGSKGQLRVPDIFTIGVPVFEDGEHYAVNCRLRYRIADQGALSMWFDMERPHKIVEHAVSELRAKIEDATQRKTLNGSRAS